MSNEIIVGLIGLLTVAGGILSGAVQVSGWLTYDYGS